MTSHTNRIKVLSAVVGGGAVVTLGAMGVALGQQPPDGGTVAKSSSMTIGATSTETTPSNAPQVAVARPTLKGPAPLPSEEAAAK